VSPWDKWTNGVSIVPTADGKSYRMYYSGGPGAGVGFAEASVNDSLTWKEHSSSPVLKPRADNWEGNKIIIETGVRLAVRSGATATPDQGWGDWVEVKRGQAVAARQYVQVRARLWSKDPALSPALNRVVLAAR